MVWACFPLERGQHVARERGLGGVDAQSVEERAVLGAQLERLRHVGDDIRLADRHPEADGEGPILVGLVEELGVDELVAGDGAHRDVHGGVAHPARREADRRGHAGVAGPHNGDLSGYAVTQVFQAIQNLRSGVSEVRWVRTRNPSRSISSSSVR